MKFWNEYLKTQEFKDIFQYVTSELDLFTNYFDELYKKLKIKGVSNN